MAVAGGNAIGSVSGLRLRNMGAMQCERTILRPADTHFGREIKIPVILAACDRDYMGYRESEWMAT